MKYLATLTTIFFSVACLTAADYPVAQSQNTEAFTLLSTSTGTNDTATGSTIAIERNIWHTFQVSATLTNTNTATITLAVSLDATNWLSTYALDVVATSSTNTYTQLTGKFKYVRASVAGSNATVRALYLGQ